MECRGPYFNTPTLHWIAFRAGPWFLSRVGFVFVGSIAKTIGWCNYSPQSQKSAHKTHAQLIISVLLRLKYSFSRRSSEFTSQYWAEAVNLTCMLSVDGVEDNWLPSSEMMTKKLTLSDVMMKDPSFLILTAMVTRTVTSPRPWSMTSWCWALGFTRH